MIICTPEIFCFADFSGGAFLYFWEMRADTYTGDCKIQLAIVNFGSDKAAFTPGLNRKKRKGFENERN